MSQEAIKENLASESAISAIYESALFLNDAEMQEFLEDEENPFIDEVLRFVVERSTFDLRTDVRVLRSGGEAKTFPDLMGGGFPAEIVLAREGFLKDEDDVALLRIDAAPLPALRLGKSENLASGQRVYILGYPATAEIGPSDSREATFTSGIVSAVREDRSTGKRLFQTDAKVSQGSSGGPLLDENGEVIGIVTFQTDTLRRESGDNFAFALPVEAVTALLAEARITPAEGRFGTAFRQGFAFFLERRCSRALSSFQEARATHEAFPVEASLASYESVCRGWQEQGVARDSAFAKVRSALASSDRSFIYLLFGSIVFFLGFLVILLWLFRQMRRDELEIRHLEERVQKDEFRMRSHEFEEVKRYQALQEKRPRKTKPPEKPPQSFV